MDSQDFIQLSNKAKNETEDFINRHLYNKAKGWPKTDLSGPEDADYSREERIKNVKYQECS